MVISIWLGLGLVLATMTQFRFTELPIGPGEILLAAYVLAFLPVGVLRLKGSVGAEPHAVRGSFLLCYVLLSLLLLVGCWLGHQAGVNPYWESGRDMAAYALCFLVSMGIVISHEGPESAARSLRYFLWVCVTASTIIWVAALALGTFGEINPWYGGFGVRFVGFAMNPNQNSLLLISLPFLLLFALRDPGLSRRARILGIGLGAFGIAAGWSTGSAALRLTWIILVPLAVLVPVLLRSGVKVVKEEWEFLVALLMGAVLVVGSSTKALSVLSDIFGLSAGTGTAHSNVILLSGGAEWTDRFVLWKNAWPVIKDSPWFGHGPGPLSGLEGPFGGSEAHNSLIDWTMASGLIGAGVLVALAVGVAWRSLRTCQSDLLFALLALSMFGMAHQILRHPMVWAILTLVAIAVSTRPASDQELAGIKAIK